MRALVLGLRYLLQLPLMVRAFVRVVTSLCWTGDGMYSTADASAPACSPCSDGVLEWVDSFAYACPVDSDGIAVADSSYDGDAFLCAADSCGVEYDYTFPLGGAAYLTVECSGGTGLYVVTV